MSVLFFLSNRVCTPWFTNDNRIIVVNQRFCIPVVRKVRFRIFSTQNFYENRFSETRFYRNALWYRCRRMSRIRPFRYIVFVYTNRRSFSQKPRIPVCQILIWNLICPVVYALFVQRRTRANLADETFGFTPNFRPQTPDL